MHPWIRWISPVYYQLTGKSSRKILSDKSGNLWVTGYYPSSFIISFLPNEVLPLSMEGVKQNLGVIASPQFSQEKNYYWISKRNWGCMLMICCSKRSHVCC